MTKSLIIPLLYTEAGGDLVECIGHRPTLIGSRLLCTWILHHRTCLWGYISGGIGFKAVNLYQYNYCKLLFILPVNNCGNWLLLHVTAHAEEMEVWYFFCERLCVYGVLLNLIEMCCTSCHHFTSSSSSPGSSLQCWLHQLEKTAVQINHDGQPILCREPVL